MIEIFIIGAIILFLFIYTGRINKSKFVDDNKGIFMLLKESDYDFLLRAKYGDLVYDSDIVFMQRIRNAGIVLALLIFVFISDLSFLNVIVSFIIAFVVFKFQYIQLKNYYKNHLNEVDSLLPYYLKSLEILNYNNNRYF